MSESDDTRALRQPLEPRSLYGDQLAPGALAGEYVIESEISSGGWGTVYLARHRTLGRAAAVKVLHRELANLPQQYKRFVAEAKAANRIGHPNIVDIFEFGRLPDARPYFVMELLQGATLDEEIHQRGPLPVTDVLAIATQLGDALTAAHDVQIIHRDLKASNVHVRRVEHGWTVKLLDFGIAKYLDPDDDASGLTTTTTRLGSPDSMAPEQIKGFPTDARTDVYALGVLLYQMLTGAPPFHAESALQLEQMHLETTPAPPSRVAKVADALDRMVLRCLSKRAADRYPSIAEAVAALTNACASSAGEPAETNAVAVYVEARLSSDEPADDVLDTLAEGLGRVEEGLLARGYTLALHGGNAVLGIRPDGDRSELMGADAVSFARELGRELGATDELAWLVVAHRGAVVLAPDGNTVVGGALTRLAEWPIRGCPPGAYASATLTPTEDGAGLGSLLP